MDTQALNQSNTWEETAGTSIICNIMGTIRPEVAMLRIHVTSSGLESYLITTDCRDVRDPLKWVMAKPVPRLVSHAVKLEF